MTEPSAFGPGALVGGYRILQPLGEGGMGAVYLAYDTELERQVALKWLKRTTPASIERLKKEALLHARVVHPAVCRLYRVAEHEGLPYLVMQYIHGHTLDRIAPELSLHAKLRLMVAVTDGLHAAHQLGLIHRDIKPSNLMVEPDEAGAWRPYIMDFGLARDLDASALSEAGTLVGSPAYMAPEQVSGGWVDRRADVYGLGAVLFEILTGRPPFQGVTATEILTQVQTQEAPRLRQIVPDLSKDLETVVQTCLAKDPAQRYLSAAALRDDLQRILDGEPIQARPMSLAERSVRWIRRNKLSSALAAVVCLSLLVTGGVRIRIRQKARAQTYWAQRFGQEILRMDGVLRFGRMLPAHDLTREFEQVRQRMEDVHSQMVRNKDSQGPGHFALGEGHLILGQPGRAKTELQAAWNGGYRSAEMSLALGNCFIDLYDEAYPESLNITDAQQRQYLQTKLKRDYLEPALQHLKRARHDLGGLPQMEEIRLALAEKRFEDATSLAQTVHRAEPWRSESLIYLASALTLQAQEAFNAGRSPNAKQTFETALDVLDMAQRSSPGDERVFERQGFTWFLGRSLSLRHADAWTSLEQALKATERAMTLTHRMASALTMRQALILLRMGHQADLRGEDPEPCFRRAESAMQSALVTSGEEAGFNIRTQAFDNLIDLAWTRINRAQYRNQDALPFLKEGLRYFQRAETEGQITWTTLQGGAGLYLAMSEYQRSHGEDGSLALEGAINTMKKAVGMHRDAQSFGMLALLLNGQAEEKLEQGKDPETDLQEAHRAIQQAFDLAPDLSDIYCDLGNITLVEARWASLRGEDALPVLDRGRAVFEKAREAHRSKNFMVQVDALYLPGLAKAHVMTAEALQARHENPIPDARKALDYGRRALTVKETDVKEVKQTMARAQKILRGKMMARPMTRG